MTLKKNRRATHRFARAFVCVALGIWTCACAAASRGPESGRPRANQAAYPVVLGASEERREKALALWTALLSDQGIANPPAPQLQPVTATLQELPPLSAPLRLPTVGGADGKEPTDEETRESLRRFIESASTLLGVEPQNVSLVAVEHGTGGAQRARYQQKPFLHPLRGGFGVLEIGFTPDRRVTQFSSTAIPDTERIGRALATIRTEVTADKATTGLAGRTVNFTDAAGQPQTYIVPASGEIQARELVVFPVRRAADPAALEFHLAWEVAVGTGDTAPRVYVDAVTGEVLGAAPAPPAKDTLSALFP